MAKDIEIYRFAFGTKEEPGSAVWRVSVPKSDGSIYINNAPQFGAQIHISLHASGNFHMKLNNERYDLEPPFIQENSPFIHGPVVFFDIQPRNLPPPPATGSLEKINWLGWPKAGHLFAVSTFYCDPEIKIGPEAHERVICGPLNAKLFHKEKNFYVIVAEREQTAEERENSQDPYKNLEFDGGLPQAVELIKISKTPQGPSAIVIDGFTASKKASVT